MKVFLYSLLAICLLSCETKTQVSSNPLVKHIPEAVSYVVKTADYNLLKTQLTNNLPFTNFIEKSNFKNTADLYGHLQKISIAGPAMIGLREIGKNNVDFLVISSNSQTNFSSLSLKETSIYEGSTISVYIGLANKTSEPVLFSTQIENNVLVSSSLLMIENAIRAKDSDRIPQDLIKLIDATKQDAVYAKLDQSGWLSQNSFVPFKSYQFGGWSALNFSLEPEEISFHGFNTFTDSIPGILNLFKDSQAQILKSPEFAPQSATDIKIYGISDYEIFKEEQQKLLQKSYVTDSIFEHIEEVALAKANERFIGFLHFSETNNIQAYLNRNYSIAKEFTGVPVYEIKNERTITSHFTPLLDSVQPGYASLLGQALIVSENMADLQTTLSAIQSGATLSEDVFFNKTREQLAAQSSMLFYKTYPKDFKQEKPTDYFIPKTLSKNEAYVKSNQWVADNGFFHQHISLKKQAFKEDRYQIKPLFSVTVEAPIRTPIQWVKNHLTKEYDIVLQDQNNQLYLINNKGKVLWKKQLKGPIQGDIQQVDIYKNGRLQLAFTTDTQWLILDRNGKEVAPFNKTFKGGDLGPLAVFDYDHNKEYRFVFTQGKIVYMFNREGKVVKGFKFKKAPSNIIETPQHYRIKNKDYLVFKTMDGQILIKNRIGKDRISVKKKYRFSDNPIMLLENKFSFTDLNGTLIQIDDKGKTSTKSLRVNAAHKTAHAKNQLVVLEDNILYSEGKKASLEFGLYSAPSISVVHNDIFISISDLQNQKVYLFDKDLKSVPKFPVFGTSAASIKDLGQEGLLHLVCQQGDTSFMVYGVMTPKK